MADNTEKQRIKILKKLKELQDEFTADDFCGLVVIVGHDRENNSGYITVCPYAVTVFEFLQIVNEVDEQLDAVAHDFIAEELEKSHKRYPGLESLPAPLLKELKRGASFNDYET